MSTETPGSDEILLELLKIVQELNMSVERMEKEFHEIKKSVDSLDKKIDAMIHDGFVDGDIKRHKAWHQKNIIKKIFG